MTTVRFLEDWRTYKVGEVAGLHPCIAARLLQAGIVKPVGHSRLQAEYAAYFHATETRGAG